MREARERTGGFAKNREADESSRGEGEGVCEMRCWRDLYARKP